MRFLRWLIIPCLAIGVAAQTDSGQTTTKSTSKTTTKSTTHRRRAAAAAPAVTQSDLQALKDALAAQQQQIQQLTDQLKQRDEAWQQAQQQLSQAQSAATDAQSKAAAAEQTSTQTNASITQLQSDVKDVKSNATNAALTTQDDQKKLSALEGVINRFRWTGDVRVRGESFFDRAIPDRNRARIRVRFGFEADPNQDFTAGVALASGAWTTSPVGGAPTFVDPTSTNETLTGFFEKKAIGLDRGYVTYHPQAVKWLSLTGGKFAYTWNHTNLTFDPDLNPEGFNEKLSWDFNNRFFKNFSAQGLELAYNEVAGGVTGSGTALKVNNKGIDSNAVGGSFAGIIKVANWWTITPSYTLLNWNGADSIAQAAFPVGLCATATSKGCILQPNTPAVGTPLPNPVATPVRELGNGNAFTNATFIRGTGTGQTRAFISGFEYSDFIWDNNFTTPWKRYPIRIVAEYEQNLRARFAKPALDNQDKAYLFSFIFGQQKNKHDLQFGYDWWRIEQDAVISQFDESDQRASTNNLQNRFYANWLVAKNTTATFTWWIGRTLNTNLQNAVFDPIVKAGQQDPYLNRLQFDIVYKF